jgi:hypothetical protein
VSEWTILSNHVAVITALADLQGGLRLLGETVSRDTAAQVAAKAREYAHVGKDPTYPRGRPHMRDTIALQPLNQYATRVVADGPAIFEEARGGEHAFLTRAVQAVEPGALDHFEQLGRAAVARMHT